MASPFSWLAKGDNNNNSGLSCCSSSLLEIDVVCRDGKKCRRIPSSTRSAGLDKGHVRVVCLSVCTGCEVKDRHGHEMRKTLLETGAEEAGVDCFDLIFLCLERLPSRHHPDRIAKRDSVKKGKKKKKLPFLEAAIFFARAKGPNIPSYLLFFTWKEKGRYCFPPASQKEGPAKQSRSFSSQYIPPSLYLVSFFHF